MSALPASHEQQLFFLLPLAVFYLDQDSIVTDANQAAEALIRKPLREMVRHPFSACIQDEALLRMAEDTITNGTTSRIQQSEIILHGEKIQATLHLAPLWEAGKESEPAGAVIVIDPLQHAERFLKKKEQQEKSRTAGLAAAMLAHEIKNPLSSIRSAAQMMQEFASPSPVGGGSGWGHSEHSATVNAPLPTSPLLGEELSQYASLIVREVDRVAGMMQRMEYLSQDAPLSFEPVNIHEVLRYAVSVISPELIRHVKVKEKFDPSLPPVAGDKDLLIHLFLNLIKNAAEALSKTPEPKLTISTRCASDFRIMHGGKRTLPIYIDIEDNGAGIPEEVKAQLFTPFVTTKRGGNGLGMVIAAKIATDHGGTVEVLETQQGKTLIRVILTSL